MTVAVGLAWLEAARFLRAQADDQSVDPLLRPFAETFITLQSAREHADYALDQPVDAVQADQTMAYLENLMEDWRSLGQDLKAQFAQQLLLRVMPNQR